MDIAKLYPVLSQEPGCAFIILCPQQLSVIPLPKIKIDIKYVVDIFNDPTSVWWEKITFKITINMIMFHTVLK